VTDQETSLAEAIDAVRAELRKAQNSGHTSDVRFSVGSVEIELAVEVVNAGKANVSVNVLNLVRVGGEGSVSKSATNRVTVSLNPLGVGGKPFEVASKQPHRPDATPDGSKS
jgi:Trypsin-co-occurring domain 2